MYASYAVMDCPEWRLGALPSFVPPGKPNPFELCQPMHEGEVEINGVPLPHAVIIELRKLGIPLSYYTHGQLQEAVEACAVDCNLIDDPNGGNFQDKLHLTADEIEEHALSRL